MAFSTIRGVRILSLFKCPCYYNNSAKSMRTSRRSLATNVTCTGKSSQCATPAEPACGKLFKTAPCVTKTQKVQLPQPAAAALKEPEIKSKRNLSCCGDPCPDALPRFDKLYYRRSDKSQRSYQQTWDECPEMLIKPKLLCCQTPIKAKLKRRSRKDRPQTACGQEICLRNVSKCAHVNTPGCKAGRKPPACLRQTKPSNCQKRRPPYPSFSECNRAKARAVINHCSCLTIPSICEVWAQYHRMQTFKKPSQC